ncbi:MAG: DHA2 family efflux MFS transporter permease subunit [Hyphomonadaceae bacterium]
MADAHALPRLTGAAAPLTGAALYLAAILIGFGNFLVVLDLTIANVSVPSIAGALGVSPSQGTWVITAYAVAEAITVPLTAWLATRFGAQRVFIFCYLAFAALSLFCGLANSLGMLIGGRVLLGLVGGPIIPLSQMLMLRIFPPEKAAIGNVLWAMTTLVGPVVGPILGGVICDTIGWQWIFFIKVPLAAAGGFAVFSLLRRQPDPTQRAAIDIVGLGLLVLWVGALQIMLDEGRNLDWFASHEIQALAAIAGVGFAAFVIWELTEKNPIVDLRIFRHRGFVASALTFSAGYGGLFAILIILPLWLQSSMGYTATWAGYATGFLGLLSLAAAPLVGWATQKFDPRAVVSAGLVGLALTAMWRLSFTPDLTFLQLAAPNILTGLFLVMFLVPVAGLCMASVNPNEQANAAGASNFMRTLAGAFAVSLVQTGWFNSMRVNQTELVNAMQNDHAALDAATAAGLPPQAGTVLLYGLVEGQSVMLATLNMFAAIAICFLFSAALIWFAPKPKGPIDISGRH